MHDRTPDAELLLAQSGWVLALARRLAGDAHLGEDVAQEALIAALRAPAARGAGEDGVRAWLAGAVHNLARFARRGEARRRARERTAARPEAMASTAETVERAARFQLVVEAVMALDEPARSTLLLRYFDGLGYEAIARRSGCSAAAARKRVSRAVERLRAELDARVEGGRSAWLSALAPLAEGGAKLAGAGGATMGVKTGIGVAAAVALAVCFGVWRSGAVGNGPAVPAAAIRSAAVGPPAEEPRPRVALERPRGVSGPSEPGAPPAPSPELVSSKPRPPLPAVAPADDADEGVEEARGIRGRVVCDDDVRRRHPVREVVPDQALLAWPGDPDAVDRSDREVRIGPDGGLADVVVLVEPRGWEPERDGTGLRWLRIDQMRFEPHVVVARPGTVLTVENRDPYGVQVFSEGRLPRFSRLLDPYTRHELVLDEVGVGRFRSDDQPWMSADVVVTDARWPAVTGADGCFDRPDVAPGKHRVELWHGGRRVETMTVEVEEGRATQLDLVYDGRRIRDARER